MPSCSQPPPPHHQITPSPHTPDPPYPSRSASPQPRQSPLRPPIILDENARTEKIGGKQEPPMPIRHTRTRENGREENNNTKQVPSAAFETHLDTRTRRIQILPSR